MSQELPELGAVSHYSRMPKVLRSSETGKPISNCMVCSKFLLDDGTPYMIEKSIRQYRDSKVTDVIFEYAICIACAEAMNAAMSVESRQRINQYFADHAGLADRRRELLKRKQQRIMPWINKCVIKGTPIAETSEYQIVAQCDGKHMLYTYMPFALSLEAMNEMTELMSAQSLGEMDDFIGRYFSGPPEVAAILRRRLVFF